MKKRVEFAVFIKMQNRLLISGEIVCDYVKYYLLCQA